METNTNQDENNNDNNNNIFESTDQELESVNLDEGENAKAGSPTTTITNEPHLIQDKDQLEKYVVKNISRQDISADMLATLDEDYYNNVEKYLSSTEKVNRYFWTNIDDFVNTRIAIILSMSESFSSTVFTKLSIEEKELYSKICELVDSHRKEIYSKVKKKSLDG